MLPTVSIDPLHQKRRQIHWNLVATDENQERVTEGSGKRDQEQGDIPVARDDADPSAMVFGS